MKGIDSIIEMWKESPATLAMTCWIIYEPITGTSVSESRSVVSDSLWPHGLYSPWNSPGQNTGMGSLSLLQRIFPTQGLNPGLQHCRWIFLPAESQGRPRILEWVAYPFSSRSSQPRNRTRVSCIAGRFFTNWAMREALISIKWHLLRTKYLLPSLVLMSPQIYQISSVSNKQKMDLTSGLTFQ